jgi:hypothetical protein
VEAAVEVSKLLSVKAAVEVFEAAVKVLSPPSRFRGCR